MSSRHLGLLKKGDGALRLGEREHDDGDGSDAEEDEPAALRPGGHMFSVRVAGATCCRSRRRLRVGGGGVSRACVSQRRS